MAVTCNCGESVCTMTNGVSRPFSLRLILLRRPWVPCEQSDSKLVPLRS